MKVKFSEVKDSEYFCTDEMMGAAYRFRKINGVAYKTGPQHPMFFFSPETEVWVNREEWKQIHELSPGDNFYASDVYSKLVMTDCRMGNGYRYCVNLDNPGILLGLRDDVRVKVLGKD